MTDRDTAPIGQPCWFDIQCDDLEQTRSFYAAVCGWEAGESSEEFGGYFQFFHRGRPVGGGAPRMSPDAPNAWTLYFAVPDAGAFVERAAAAGAQIYFPAMQVGDLGTMAIAGDPSGATFGVWAPIEFQGFGAVGEVGAPSWYDLHSRDYARAVPFYAEVFGWDTQVVSDTDEFRYTVAREGESPFCGIVDARDLPEGSPGHWVVYVGVADVDAAVATATSLGGAVAMAPTDTPFGRLAEITDPGGARLRLGTV